MGLGRRAGPGHDRVLTHVSSVADDGSPRSSPTKFTGIAGADGEALGYVKTSALDNAILEGEPRLRLGSGTFEAKGYEVESLDGRLIGYFLSGNTGFVPLATARDEKSMDAILAARERELATPASPDVVRMQQELLAQVRGG